MSKIVRAAKTSQTLSLAAMEEASRLGRREADIEHLFLALVINDQSAGRALRGLGIDIDAARRAVEEQHDTQLASLGVGAVFPEAGRIVFHETDGYEWTARASDLIAAASGAGKAGDAAAVLRELVAEPSGLVTDILGRLGTSPDAVLEHLDEVDARDEETVPAAAPARGRTTGSTDVFVSAPMDEVWAFLADPARIPEWEPGIGVIEHTSQDATPGAVWEGFAPRNHPNGKPLKIKAQFRRRAIELVTAVQPDRVAWRFSYPDSARSGSVLTEFVVANTTGGTQVRITRSWPRRDGWRGVVATPLRPLQRFFAWIALFQTAGAISRAFR